MPSNILAADVLFPHLTEKQSTDEKFTVVTDYLFMLLEQLRYTLANLGQENFNETELENIGNVITEPVYVMLQGLEGQMASLSLTAEGLASRVSDAEGNISTLTQTSSAISQRVSNAEGNISTLTQTASGLEARVASAEGDISSLSQTASSISFRVTSAEGNISSLTQTVRGMTLAVVNGEQSSVISLMQNGIAVSSQAIQITGMVTFASLSGSGTSVINGDNIKTGTITAITLRSKMYAYGASLGGYEMYWVDTYEREYLAGALMTEEVDGAYRVYLRSRNTSDGKNFVLKLYSESAASLESEYLTYIGSTTSIGIQAPRIDLWGDVYINNQLVYPA